MNAVIVPPKKPWLSKTLLTNVIVAIIAFFPKVNESIDASQVMMLMGVINIILRLLTKEKIGLGD